MMRFLLCCGLALWSISGGGRCAIAAELPALPGTNWQLLSLTGKGEPITDAQNPADVQFLNDGTWSIRHYGGRLEGGKYQVSGERLVMRTEDGAVYSDSQASHKPADQILELSSDDGYLMRLRRQKAR